MLSPAGGGCCGGEALRARSADVPVDTGAVFECGSPPVLLSALTSFSCSCCCISRNWSWNAMPSIDALICGRRGAISTLRATWQMWVWARYPPACLSALASQGSYQQMPPPPLSPGQVCGLGALLADGPLGRLAAALRTACCSAGARAWQPVLRRCVASWQPVQQRHAALCGDDTWRNMAMRRSVRTLAAPLAGPVRIGDGGG